MEGVGEAIETGAKVVESVAKATVEGTEAVAQTVGGAAEIGTSLTKNVTPIISDGTNAITTIGNPLIEAASSTGPIAETADIGTQISQAATELAGAQTVHTNFLRNGNEAERFKIAAEIGKIREELDRLNLQRHIDNLGQGAENSKNSGKRFTIKEAAWVLGDALLKNPSEEDSSNNKKDIRETKSKNIPAGEASLATVATEETVTPIVAEATEGTVRVTNTIGTSAAETMAPAAKATVETVVPTVQKTIESTAQLGQLVGESIIK